MCCHERSLGGQWTFDLSSEQGQFRAHDVTWDGFILFYSFLFSFKIFHDNGATTLGHSAAAAGYPWSPGGSIGEPITEIYAMVERGMRTLLGARGGGGDFQSAVYNQRSHLPTTTTAAAQHNQTPTNRQTKPPQRTECAPKKTPTRHPPKSGMPSPSSRNRAPSRPSSMSTSRKR